MSQVAHLHGRNLRGQILRGNLSESDFIGADLRHSDLSGASGLRRETLRGANLQGAKLPPGVLSDAALSGLSARFAKLRANIFAALAACLYLCLAALHVSDIDLVTERGIVSLPLVGANVPISSLFSFGPVLVLSMAAYLAVQLNGLLKELCGLPAVLPDGRSPVDVVGSWMPGGLYEISVRSWKSKPVALFRAFIIALACWFFLPATAGIIFGRYVVTNDVWPLVLQGTVTIGTCLLGLWAFSPVLHWISEPGRGAGWLERLKGIGSHLFVFSVMLVVVIILASLPQGLGGHDGFWRTNLVLEQPESRSSEGGILSLDGRTLDRANAAELKFERVSFRAASLHNADFTSTHFIDVDLRDIKAKGITLSGAVLEGVDARRADLRGANLRGVRFVGQFNSLANADLAGADLSGADLSKVNLRNANLEGAILERTVLCHADLRNARLSNALLHGADLYMADLSVAMAHGTDLRKANLEGAKLFGSDLTCARLVDACAKRTQFHHARLQWAQMDRIDLQGAILRGARLGGVVLFGARLRDADFTAVQWHLVEVSDLDESICSTPVAEKADLRFTERDETRGLDELPEQVIALTTNTKVSLVGACRNAKLELKKSEVGEALMNDKGNPDLIPAQ